MVIFADACRAGYAEAKSLSANQPVPLPDACRAGYAEAKTAMDSGMIACIAMHAAQATLRQSGQALVERYGAHDACRAGYAEAKYCHPCWNDRLLRMHAAQATLRQR